MSRFICFIAAFCIISFSTGIAYSADNTLPDDPWKKGETPDIKVLDHVPINENVIKQENLAADLSFPNAPAKFDDNGYITKDFLMYFTTHLRNKGYDIDPKFDNLIVNAPKKITGNILAALYEVKRSEDPVLLQVGNLVTRIENETGLDLANLIEKSAENLVNPIPSN